MKKILNIFLLLPFLLSAQTTYYIDTAGDDDTGDGSSGSLWASLDYACTQVTTAGDTIRVNAGSYSEANRCELSAGVSIVDADSSNTTISFTYETTGTDYEDGAILLYSASQGTNGNQVIRDIHFDGSDTIADNGIVVRARSNVKIFNCKITNFHYNGISIRGLATGFRQRPSSYAYGCEIYNNYIDNCGSRDNEVYATEDFRGHGAITYGGTDSLLIYGNYIRSKARTYNGNSIDVAEGYNKGTKIYNNDFYRNETEDGTWGFFIEHWFSDGGVEIYDNNFYGGCVGTDWGQQNIRGGYDYSIWIHDNLFEKSAQQSFSTPIQYACALEDEVDGFIFERNRVVNYPTAFYATTTSAAAEHRDIEVSYNVFENCGWTEADYTAAIQFIAFTAGSTVRNLRFYNNVVESNATSRNYAAIRIRTQNSCTFDSVAIVNNIFLNQRDFLYLDIESGGIDSLFSRNNIIYNVVNPDTVYDDKVSTVTNYIVSDTLQQDPLIVGGGDYSLQASSPAIDAGTDIGLTTDYLGNTVPYNSIVDIGAYEYGASAPVDPPTGSVRPSGAGGKVYGLVGVL